MFTRYDWTEVNDSFKTCFDPISSTLERLLLTDGQRTISVKFYNGDVKGKVRVNYYNNVAADKFDIADRGSYFPVVTIELHDVANADASSKVIEYAGLLVNKYFF